MTDKNFTQRATILRVNQNEAICGGCGSFLERGGDIREIAIPTGQLADWPIISAIDWPVVVPHLNYAAIIVFCFPLLFVWMWHKGENLRFSGRMTGKINSVDVPSINVDIIAMTKDGRAYVVIRDPPASLQHSLKILTPFVNLVGWMFAVKKTMGVRNGIQVIGEKFTRSAIISFNSGKSPWMYH